MKCYIKFFQAIVVLAVILFTRFVLAEETGIDVYENDNFLKSAKIIILNNESSQKHNLYETNDEDWVKFFGLRDETYEVKAENVGRNCNIVIELYDKNETFLKDENTGTEGDDALLTFSTPEDDIYYIKIYNISELSGNDTGYSLSLNFPKAPVVALFHGDVEDAVSKSRLGNVMIRTEENFSALSDENADGTYNLYHSTDESLLTRLTARLSGYQVFTKPVFTTGTGFKTPVNTGGKRDDTVLVEWDGLIEMVPKGDITGDGKIDLADAVAALQTAAGTAVPGTVRPDYIASEKYKIASEADVNGDDKVGLEEAIHILKKQAQ